MLSLETRTTVSDALRHRACSLVATSAGGVLEAVVVALRLGRALSTRCASPVHATVAAIAHVTSAARDGREKPPPATDIADGGFD
jgi:hypothetical protein